MIHNVRTGQDLNELDNYAVRGQLLFVPTENLKLRLIADVSDLNSACCTQSYLRVGRSLRSAARQFPALAAGLGYAPASTNVYDRVNDIDADLMIDTQDGGVSLITEWASGPRTSLPSPRGATGIGTSRTTVTTPASRSRPFSAFRRVRINTARSSASPRTAMGR